MRLWKRPWPRHAHDTPDIPAIPAPPEIPAADHADGGNPPAGAVAPAGAKRGRLFAVVANLLIVVAAAFCAAVLALSVGPRFLPYQTSTVLTGSMEPTLPVGSIIILRPAAATELKVGDIITFNRPDRTGEIVTHRIMGVELDRDSRRFQTKGDANAYPDNWQVIGSGQGWRCVFAIPHAGRMLGWLQLPWVHLLLVATPALLLGGLVLRDIWRAPVQRRLPV